MRVGLAAVFQLTNTFCRRSTTIESFFGDTATRSRELICDPFGIRCLTDQIQGKGRERNVEFSTGPVAIAGSSGPATHDCVSQLSDRISLSIAEFGSELDAFVLVLSGTMLDQDLRSVDRQLIELSRQTLKPDVPLIVLLSSYANIDEDAVRRVISDSAPCLMLGFHPGDGQDADRTASQVIRACDHVVRGQCDQSTLVQWLPILIAPAVQELSDSPLHSLTRIAAEFSSTPGVLDASLFPGFPYADVGSAGFGISVTASQEKARGLLERLRRAVWDRREDFAFHPMNVEVAVHNAMLANPGPAVVAELGDDPTFGACCDGTGLLWAFIDLGVPESALGVIVDPVSVAAAIAAGVGSRVKLDIGGAMDSRAGYPVTVTGTVRRVADGQLTLDEGCTVNLGKTVVLDIEGRHGGQIDVIVSERSPQLITPSVLSTLGIDVTHKKIVGVKSSVGLQRHFGSVGAAIIRTSTPGITTPVLNHFDYRRVQRPIYPIDEM